MRDVFLLAIFLGFIGLGLSAPFVVGLGYIWVDLFNPQRVSYGLLAGAQLSLVLAVASIGLYFLTDRRDPPRFGLELLLLSALAAWITLTTTWAVSPDAAWAKWNWAIKVVCFSVFIPFLFRTETQIEAMLLTVIFSISGSLMTFAVKTVVSGGGYGRSLALIGGSFGLGEGSILAGTAVALVPLILFFATKSRLLPRHWTVKWFMYGLAAAAVATAIGTFARTGLVALAVLAVIGWWMSRRKLLLGLLYLGIAGAAPIFVDQNWADRMSTISEYNEESSALGRLAVWRWTLEFVGEHPLGGGFDAYRINRLTTEVAGKTVELGAKAFHSIYFEVLGEHGIVGLTIFVLILAGMFINLRAVSRVDRSTPQGAWMAELSRAMTVSTLVYLAAGAFVGIAFQPFLYYLISGSIALRALAKRQATSKAAGVMLPAILAPALGQRLGPGPGTATEDGGLRLPYHYGAGRRDTGGPSRPRNKMWSHRANRR